MVWVYFDEQTMRLGPFLYFGEEAGKPLPSLGDYKIAKHTKGNSDGVKTERQNIKVLPKRAFKIIESVEKIYDQLFRVN